MKIVMISVILLSISMSAQASRLYCLLSENSVPKDQREVVSTENNNSMVLSFENIVATGAINDGGTSIELKISEKMSDGADDDLIASTDVTILDTSTILSDYTIMGKRSNGKRVGMRCHLHRN